MYPLLGSDPRMAAWIERATRELGELAARRRAELDAANRSAEFPRAIYEELGRLGYLGPLVPREYGGLGGGVAEYVVIAEEIGRHGLVSGQVAVQGQRWLLDWGTDQQKDALVAGDRDRERRLLGVDQREGRGFVLQADGVAGSSRRRRLDP